MKETKYIPFDGLKPHEILAVTLYFYNNEYYLSKIDDTYQYKGIFKDKYYLYDEPHDYFTTEHTKNYNNINYQFKFTTSGKTRYDSYGNKTDLVRVDLNADNNQLATFSIKDTRGINKNRTFSLDENEDLEKFLNSQTTTIKKLKFYEEHFKKIYEYLNVCTTTNKITLEYLYGFKSYVKNILAYSGEDLVSVLKSFSDCCVFDMQKGVTYTNKILSFKKINSDLLDITINKSVIYKIFLSQFREDIKNNDVSKFFNLFVPIFQQLGGICELQAIILKDRLITE